MQLYCTIKLNFKTATYTNEKTENTEDCCNIVLHFQNLTCHVAIGPMHTTDFPDFKSNHHNPHCWHEKLVDGTTLFSKERHLRKWVGKNEKTQQRTSAKRPAQHECVNDLSWDKFPAGLYLYPTLFSPTASEPGRKLPCQRTRELIFPV
jgi:hypothetical protein